MNAHNIFILRDINICNIYGVHNILVKDEIISQLLFLKMTFNIQSDGKRANSSPVKAAVERLGAQLVADGTGFRNL